jgi:hypothetical protein
MNQSPKNLKLLGKLRFSKSFPKKKVLIKFKDFKKFKEFITGGNPVLFLQNNHQKKKKKKKIK